MADDSPAKPLSIAGMNKLRRVVKAVLNDGGERRLPAFLTSITENRFRAEITGAVQQGTDFRWDYTVRPQRKSADGTAFENNPSVEADLDALNLVEENNTDTGVVSGYDLDADANIVGVEPIGIGEIVDCWVEGWPWDGGSIGSPGYVVYFSRDNKPIVDCQAASSF
jgi:hypothetical protein